MTDQGSKQRNRLLKALSNAGLVLLQPHLEHAPLKFRQRVQSANRDVKYVYVPASGIASVVAVSGGEHRQAEIAIVGRDGMTGLTVVLGPDRSHCETFIQVAGEGQCISAKNLRDAIDQSVTMLK